MEVAERTSHLIGAVVEENLGRPGRAVLRVIRRVDPLELGHGDRGAADHVDQTCPDPVLEVLLAHLANLIPSLHDGHGCGDVCARGEHRGTWFGIPACQREV